MIANENPLHFSSCDDYFKAVFTAMASPCEFLIATSDEILARKVAEQGLAEVRRIEKKFSRYQNNNICYEINNAGGKSVEIDDECYRLLSFAQTCYDISEGMFDLTSGVLRRAWHFDCSNNIPPQKHIDEILPLVGWQHIEFDEQRIQMKPNMEIDFGGIGKEYAVSCVVEIVKKIAPSVSVLVNLGGDIQITESKKNQEPWSVGVESVNLSAASEQNPNKILSIMNGALATSGDAKRYLLKNGKRYSHILNPKTGWPIMHAPASITVVAPLCVQAGCLATLALLQGKGAEAFLKAQGVQYWCERA